VSAGDNPERLQSEAAGAHLCGVSPVPADSGKNAGHFRRHNGGNRQANSALWRIAMVRIAHDPETTHYFDRRVKEGRTKRDVIRILQRYIAREVYRYLPRGRLPGSLVWPIPSLSPLAVDLPVTRRPTTRDHSHQDA
jgi:hypothetical protein